MKKRWLLICFLITSVLAGMIQGTSAIYTWSKDFAFQLTLDEKEPEHPLHEGDFLHYEMLNDYKNSGVDFNLDRNEISIYGEAGAFRYFPNDQYRHLANYHVNARITSLQPKELKNLGITFQGSYANNTGSDNCYDAMGYVLKFDEIGDVYIQTQSIDHRNGNDSYGDMEGVQEKLFIMKADELIKRLGNLDFNRSIFFDIYVHKEASWQSESWASIYINDILINPNPQRLNHELREFISDGSKANVSIAVSTYQLRDAQGNFIDDPLRQAKVNDLYIEAWDGVLPPSK